jgi:H+/Cl- antiporter ClcA
MSHQATVDRMAGLAILASLIAGLIAGIGARIIMRIVAQTARLPPQFDIAGTLNVVFLGLFLGFVAGFVYTLCIIALSNWTKTSKYVPGPLWRGPAFGMLLLLILLPMLLGPSSPTDDINLGIPLLNRCMFAALPIIYGFMLGGAEKILDHYFPRKPTALTTEVSGPQPH